MLSDGKRMMTWWHCIMYNINIISYIADMLQASKTKNSVDSPTITGLRTGRGQRLLLSVENRLYNVEARPRYQPGITDEKNKLFWKEETEKQIFKKINFQKSSLRDLEKLRLRWWVKKDPWGQMFRYILNQERKWRGTHGGEGLEWSQESKL